MTPIEIHWAFKKLRIKLAGLNALLLHDKITAVEYDKRLEKLEQEFSRLIDSSDHISADIEKK